MTGLPASKLNELEHAIGRYHLAFSTTPERQVYFFVTDVQARTDDNPMGQLFSCTLNQLEFYALANDIARALQVSKEENVGTWRLLSFGDVIAWHETGEIPRGWHEKEQSGQLVLAPKWETS